jgi:MAF protein
VLASESPRRRELFQAIASQFTVVPADLDESLEPGCDVTAEVERLARAKADSVARRLPASLVIAADTLVSLDGAPLGKPADDIEARRMLKALSGREHRVLTGVAVAWTAGSAVPAGKPRVVSSVAETTLVMRSFSEREIMRSIATRTPFDKAGGYGIQDSEFRPVAGFHGCYCNVLGLPLWVVYRLLSARNAPADRPDGTRAICRGCPQRPEAE